MFWSGNFIAVREINTLLKKENVTLTQVLEADDVLQECMADNKALIQFLTRPDILAELVTLITEEPPKNVALSLQYRHSTIACEVLTSQLPTLSDRLSMDTVQMHRLCDFLNREPPLNPLLASYFSKTIEMLLNRSTKQDYYLYHIVCLRVLDFLKARRDFLPNLLRHLHTSAVLDALKCFIRLNDLFHKLIMEWLEEHQFLESLIAIICGTYEPPPLAPRPAPDVEKGQQEQSEKAEREASEKGDLDAQGKEVPAEESTSNAACAGDSNLESSAETVAETEEEAERRRERLRAVAAANAASLLSDIILNGCASDYSQASPAGNAKSGTARALTRRSCSAGGVRALLAAVFTCPAPARQPALVHGARLLLAMRRADAQAERDDDDRDPSSGAGCRGGVELAVAPHLPLLHTALLQPPEPYMHEPSAEEAPTDGGGGEAAAAAAAAAGVVILTEGEPPAPSGAASPPPAPARAPPRPAVGAARLQVAALLAALCSSEVDEVASTMLTLGTPGVLIDMFFAHPDNNFLHAQVLAMLRHALSNRAYRTQYLRHILDECDFFNRLMDVYEENETNRGTAGRPRAGYMGHVLQLASALAPALEERAADRERWAASSVHLLLQRRDTPLGGYYPSQNTYVPESGYDPSENTYVAESDGMVEAETRLYNFTNYSDVTAEEDLSEVTSTANMNKFMELSNQRMCDSQADMWDDAPEGEEGGEGGEGGEGEGTDFDDDTWGPSQAAEKIAAFLATRNPWASSEASTANEGWAQDWAQWAQDAFGTPVDPFADTDTRKPDTRNTDTRNTDTRNTDTGNTDTGNADAFSTDPFNADAFTKRERSDGAPFGKESFEGAAGEKFAPWGFQDEEGEEANSTSGVEQGLRNMQLDAMDKPLDALSSSLADNLRTAMSSMTPEVIANIVNANMTPALDVPLADSTDASGVAPPSPAADAPAPAADSVSDNTVVSDSVSDNTASSDSVSEPSASDQPSTTES